MLRFIAGTFTLTVVIALAGALYLAIGAYNMPVGERYSCAYESNDSAVCKTYLVLEAHSSN